MLTIQVLLHKIVVFHDLFCVKCEFLVFSCRDASNKNDQSADISWKRRVTCTHSHISSIIVVVLIVFFFLLWLPCPSGCDIQPQTIQNLFRHKKWVVVIRFFFFHMVLLIVVLFMELQVHSYNIENVIGFDFC